MILYSQEQINHTFQDKGGNDYEEKNFSYLVISCTYC